MTAHTASAQSTRLIEPESLIGHTRLGAAEHRTVVKLLFWLMRLRQKDQAHPAVRRWGVPAFCAVLGVPSLVDAADESWADLLTVLALIAGLTVPLLWRR